MNRVIVTNFVSLDGVIEAPLSTERGGGWVEPYADEAVKRTMSETTVHAGGMLLGRRTYEIFAATWPYADDSEPAVAAMNRMPKYVASTTMRPEDASWAGTVVLGTDDLPAEIAELKQQQPAAGDLVVFGSGRLIQTLIEHDLIDEYRLLVFPLVLGQGKRLFPTGGRPAGLQLIDASTSTSGVLIATYQPAREGCEA
jgi:dihydrofolate reductase